MCKANIQLIINNIRRLRERDFISQEYMAQKLGIGQNSYSKIELGKTHLTVEKLFYIAEILGVEVTELFKEQKA